MDRRPGGWKLFIHSIDCSGIVQNWAFTLYLPGQDFPCPSWPLKKTLCLRMTHSHDFTIQVNSNNQFL